VRFKGDLDWEVDRGIWRGYGGGVGNIVLWHAFKIGEI